MILSIFNIDILQKAESLFNSQFAIQNSQPLIKVLTNVKKAAEGNHMKLKLSGEGEILVIIYCDRQMPKKVKF